MLDSLPYRNDAAMVLRRLMRSLPTRKASSASRPATKGLPAMMMASGIFGPLAQLSSCPAESLYSLRMGEDAGKVQTIGARYAQNQITLDYAAEVGCRACASPGGGCQFLGTAATSQVVGGSIRARVTAYCARSFRTADLAGCSRTLRSRHCENESTWHWDKRHSHRRCGPQRDDSSRSFWRIDQLVAYIFRQSLTRPD